MASVNAPPFVRRQMVDSSSLLRLTSLRKLVNSSLFGFGIVN